MVCGELRFQGHHRDVISNPGIVVEVLSRSTARYDRLIKVPIHQNTPTIQEILLVLQDRAKVEQISRNDGGWKTIAYSGLSVVLEIAQPAWRLPLADIYANIILSQA